MHPIERKICELIWNLSIFESNDILCSQLHSLLCEIKREWKYAIFKNDIEEQWRYIEYLSCLYCLIGYSRDIVCGYGERDLSYRIIYVWYLVFPILSIYALHSFVLPLSNSDSYGSLPYGSWKDVKYFCRAISQISVKGCNDPLISTMISIVNRQLDNGINKFAIAKWIPKETGGFSWVFDRLVLDRDPITGHKGYVKKGFRQMISSMKKEKENEKENADIETIQNCHTEYYDKIFIGDYIRGFLSSEDSSDWVKKWDKLNRSFCKIDGAIPILLLTADITDDLLRHMIGYVCLLSRSYHRVLIFSTVPIWLDISLYKDDIVGLARYLWGFCLDMRTRIDWDSCVSFLFDGISVLSSSNVSMKLFFFGSYFDCESLNVLKNRGIFPILWKIGGDWQLIPKDIRGFLLLSGKTAAIMRNFYKLYYNDNPYSWNYSILHGPRFHCLRKYLELTIEQCYPKNSNTND